MGLVTGEKNETYQYTRRFVKGRDGKNISITFFKDTDIDATEKNQVDAFYLLIMTASLIAIFIFTYLMMRLVLRPIEKNMRQQKKFIAAASHELKSPLSVMKTVLSLLPKGKYERVLEQEADRMVRLVEDLLTLAGAAAGNWMVDKQPVDTDTLLAEIYDSFLPVAQKAGTAFLLDLPKEPLPPLLGDKERLSQLLHIFLDNAVSYGKEGKWICLGARAAGHNIKLWVSDHGPGILQQEKNKIFERFYRASQSRADKAHFGLGLSVAVELVALHGGRISQEDTPGGGATFVAVLPCAAGKLRFLPAKRVGGR